MKTILAAASLALIATSAHAGWNSWTAESEADPFTKGTNVVAAYSTSQRSGAFISCDSAVPGIELKVVAGWAYVDDLAGYEPEVKVAVDGNLILTKTGKTGAFGDNIADVTVQLLGADATFFLEKFIASKSQIAIQDGISDGPHLLKARGSTKSGQQLSKCLAINTPAGEAVKPQTEKAEKREDIPRAEGPKQCPAGQVANKNGVCFAK